MKLKKIHARLVLNSRANPTIEISINGIYDSAPAGASTGSREAKYIDPYYAVKNFNKDLAPLLKDKEFLGLEDLYEIENLFFGLGGFEKFGANTLIALEYALLKAYAFYKNIDVYEIFNHEPKIGIIKPLSNIIGGGAHAKWRGPDFQEFLVLPKNAKTTAQAIFINAYIHKLVFYELSKRDPYFLGGKNDEGAWVPSLNIEEILELLVNIKNKLKEEENIEISLGVDIAATSLYKQNYYYYPKKNVKKSREEQIMYITGLIEKYDLYYVEDPLYEEDFEGFSDILKETNALIVGDDLTVTNTDLLKKAIKHNSIRGIIIKPNQVGSILKTIETVKLAKKNGIIPILSHRSGETESNILAHLAYGLEIPIVKFGIVGGERIAKLNELMRIEERLKYR